MPTNFREFAKELQSFHRDFVPSEFRKFQIKVALELFSRIILKTPVDTGRARGNWQIGIATPPTSILEEFDTHGGSTIAAGVSVLSDYTNGVVTIYIANNVPYISFLEMGTSDRAPNGMVSVSIEEVETIFQQVRSAA